MLQNELRRERARDIRLLALDLDGTLLTDDKRVTPRTAAALERPVRCGLHAVVVTGRPLGGLPEAVTGIEGIRYAITSNGAVTTDLERGEVLRTACLEARTAEEIVRLPMERGLIHNVFLGGYGYCEPPYHELLLDKFRGTGAEGYVRRSKRAAESLHALLAEPGALVENIWIVARGAGERDELDRLIRSRWDVRTVLTAASDLEAGAPGADKGEALLYLARHLGVERAQLAAFGDNENDLGMLRVSGMPVAMGNATEGVKRLAAVVTDSNGEDGAAKVIEAICAAREAES